MWIDSRIKSPSPNAFNYYTVVFLYCGSTFVGRAEWHPRENYTSGEWTKTYCNNGNPLQGQVLYWREHPKKPKIVSR